MMPLRATRYMGLRPIPRDLSPNSTNRQISASELSSTNGA